MFARRRHAEIVARRRLRIATWVGAPLATAALAWEVLQGGGMPTLGAVAFTAVALAYTVALFRIHDLTGEWTFF
ncbi:MAG: hypothetical protein P1U88_19640 [Thalassobaculaceae bacterium]|nr:hypothetical protein [Thalassobaculaceae bacterium]